MRNTKIAAAKTSSTESNKARTRSPDNAAKITETESGETMNPEKDLLTDDEIPTFTDAQQDFINEAIAHTRRQTLTENAISRNNERDYYEKQLQEMSERISTMQQDQREQMIQMAQQRQRDLPDTYTSSSVENPKHAFETPKVQRPQDMAYQAILTANKERPLHDSTPTGHGKPWDTEESQTTDMMQIYDIRMNNLLSSVGNILKHSKKEDTTELPKFLGGDSQWPKWYQLLRAYLQARGWLTTFDHPLGPGTLHCPTKDFDTDINSLIYQKLQAKCFEGTASTYVRMAAEFDGHGAGAHLKKRYNNSSPQQLESYILLAKNHRHTSGTSMPLHIDQYEAILGYMPDCGKIPTNTERIDWFIPTVTEDIYASAKAMCLTQKIQGTLEWGSMVLLFNHTCFARYPHFQIAELQTGNSLKKHTQNNTTIRSDKCALHPDGNQSHHRRMQETSSTPSQSFGRHGRTGERNAQRQRQRTRERQNCESVVPAQSKRQVRKRKR
jgi:hypothetical protein